SSPGAAEARPRLLSTARRGCSPNGAPCPISVRRCSACSATPTSDAASATPVAAESNAAFQPTVWRMACSTPIAQFSAKGSVMRTRKPLRALLAAALLGSILQFGFQSAPPEQADPPAGVEPAPAEQVEQVDPQPELQPAPVEPVEARPLVEATINRVIDGDT